MRWMTSGGAARRLGVSRVRLAELTRAGAMTFTPTPFGRMYAAADVERLAGIMRRRPNTRPPKPQAPTAPRIA